MVELYFSPLLANRLRFGKSCYQQDKAKYVKFRISGVGELLPSSVTLKKWAHLVQYILIITLNRQFKEMAQKRKISGWQTLMFIFSFLLHLYKPRR